MSREYLKIWFQDIEIASEFFEGNEKHLGEFLVNVYREYAGLPTSFKCKQVAKYFQTYRKQIQFIKNSKEFGNKGWEKKVNTQQDTSYTLGGSLEGALEEPLKQKLKVKSKRLKDKSIIPTVEEVKEYFTANGYSLETADKFFNYYQTGEWKDSKGNTVKNWKQKAQAVWFKDENKTTIVKPKIVV